MRKLLLVLTASLITSTSSNIVIACQSLNLGEIWIITDGGQLFDRAFNQQVVEGAQDFTKDFNNNRNIISQLPQYGYWKNQLMKVRWIISNGDNIATLQNNYNIAAFCGAKVIICSGFHHLNSLTPQIQKLYKKYGIRFILVDSIVQDPSNVAGITYSAEQSSFLAGLSGALWLAANYENYPNGLKMSTFGAVPADTIVSYMSGYYWGVYYYNHYRMIDKDNIDNKLLVLVNNIRAASGQQNISLNDLKSQKLAITFDKLENSFSGSFDPGTSAGNAISSAIVDDKRNNIILPVAGAQTKDLIGAIKSSAVNSSAKIIGVDTDQAIQYDTASNLFITSALKGIKPSIDWMLWNAFNLKNNNGQITTNPMAGDYFDHVDPALSDPPYVGIANNNPISAIYNTLVQPNGTYWTAAKMVTDAFNKLKIKVNSEPKPDWDDAWMNDVDPQKAPQFNPFPEK